MAQTTLTLPVEEVELQEDEPATSELLPQQFAPQTTSNQRNNAWAFRSSWAGEFWTEYTSFPLGVHKSFSIVLLITHASL